MVMSDSSVAGVPCSGVDTASAVRRPPVRLATECKAVFGDLESEEQDRPFALHPVSACRERLACHWTDRFAAFVLCFSLAQIRQQRCRAGKTQKQLKCED